MPYPTRGERLYAGVRGGQPALAAEVERLRVWMEENRINVSMLASALGMKENTIYTLLVRNSLTDSLRWRFLHVYGPDDAADVLLKPEDFAPAKPQPREKYFGPPPRRQKVTA